jgi:hypothetical protein
MRVNILYKLLPRVQDEHEFELALAACERRRSTELTNLLKCFYRPLSGTLSPTRLPREKIIGGAMTVSNIVNIVMRSMFLLFYGI